MWIEGNTINIKVTPQYVYDVWNLTKMGKESDIQGTHSAWAWINHLREKNWWNKVNEEKFIKLAEKI